ncbi:MAG TPA: TonB-dependent receptor [Steroidobacteraceae bacterium]|jgi:outer membrane receptor protein involved in Fe transport
MAAGPLTVRAAEGNIQEVVVTGSRIAQPNLTTTSPVTQVTDQDIATQGVTRIEDLINQLPQAFAAQNSSVVNGATGVATIDLRGLGDARTLVLVDGRRMPYGSIISSAADVNQIPSGLVERVEVLTGGSSAVYGSDAVAGVVNFILKKNFEGIEFEGQYGFYQHNNDYGGPGETKLRDVISAKSVDNPSQFKLPSDNVTDGFGRTGTIIMGAGTEDGRGNITAYLSYTDNDQVLQRDRDYSACTLGANPTVSFSCGGSGTAYPGTFTQDFDTNYTIGDNNTFRDFNNDSDLYNFGPVNHYLRPDTRYSLGAMGHYEINEYADVYTQLMFTDDRSVAQIAPGGIFLGDSTSINCDNPFLSGQQSGLLGCTAGDVTAGNSVPLYIGRRNVEGGGRQSDFHNTSFRIVLGSRGTIVNGWDYDVSTQFSRTSADQKTLNYFSKTRITRALDVVDNGGVPTCRSALPADDPRFGGVADANCVPYNPFVLGGVTPASLAYLQVPGIQTAVIDQHVTTAAITGDLGTIGAKLPWASEPVKVAFGAENRSDKMSNTPDAALQQFDLSGTGGPTIGFNGTTNVNDLFAEINVPLIQDKAFAKQMSVDMAYRYSDYGSGTTTDTYKFGADWAPVEDVRFRGSYQKAVRAANIIELFTAQGFNLFDLTGDPCGRDARDPAASAEACIASGVPAASVGSHALDSPAGQYNFLQGGNQTLKPEESETVSFGIVLTPRFAPGLSVSVDWFKIKIDDTISTFGADNSLDACYHNGDDAACSRIHRNELGLLWVGSGYVEDLNINIGSLETKGIDIVLNYASLDIGKAGSLSFNLTGSYLDELITNPGPGLASYDCVGFYGSPCVSPNGAPKPQWRHLARVGWQMPWQNIDLSLSWRYYGAVDLFGAPANRIDRHFSDQSYFDLAGNWEVTEKASLRVGINNILDKDPPLSASVGTTGNGNTYPQLYDALGRYIFGGLTVKF